MMRDNARAKELYDRSWMVKARLMLKFTQAKAAAECGLSQGFYCRIENGIQTPNIKDGLMISKALGVSPDVWLNERKLA